MPGGWNLRVVLVAQKADVGLVQMDIRMYIDWQVG